jgi:uncharacterized protein
MNLLVIFLTGLTTGGLSCLVLQGGLLASVIANQKEQEHDEVKGNKEKQKNFSSASFDQLDWMPVLMFLSTKLVAHTVLGFLLGILGSAITLSLSVRLAFQVFTALFMLATAMNLLNVHPIFRYVSFQPPKFLQRVVRNTSKSKALFAPGLLGLLTIFIPCGITQAMEVLAINTGNPIQGALIMFAFVLGTSPLFALLGVATAKLSEGWYQKFARIAALSLVAMAIYGINGVLIVLNSPITVNTLVSPITYFFSDERFSNISEVQATNGVQEVTISISNNGYQPSRLRVKSGQPVKLILQSKDTYSCALAFVFKEFGINTFLEANDTKVFTFTPNKPGKYQFTCSMGMYTGTMEVI